MNITEIHNQQLLLNRVTASVNGLKYMDEIPFFDADLRFTAISSLIKDFLRQLQDFATGQPIQALQINQTQVIAFFDSNPKIISVEEAERSGRRYLSLIKLRSSFGLELDIKKFDLKK